MLSILPLCLPAAAANIVTNPGFETPVLPAMGWGLYPSIPGWSLAAGGAIEVQNHAAGSPDEGSQHVELDSDGNSGIFQDLATIEGEQYLLSVAFSARPGVASNSVQIWWDGGLVDTLNASGQGLPDTDWSTFNYWLTASGATTRLQFLAAGVSDGVGEYIDDVVVDPSLALPEPASVKLLSCGLGLVLVCAGRRRR
jgi:hypothetical protein